MLIIGLSELISFHHEQQWTLVMKLELIIVNVHWMYTVKRKENEKLDKLSTIKKNIEY